MRVNCDEVIVVSKTVRRKTRKFFFTWLKVTMFKMIFSSKSLIHALAGGLGNAFSITVFYPLETTRTILQVQKQRNNKWSFEVAKNIWKKEGFEGLYRGWFSLIITMFLTSFSYFYVFHGLKAVLLAEGIQQQVATDLLFGILGGFASTFVSNPFWVVNTRLKLQHLKIKDEDRKHPEYSGTYDCFKKIIIYEGWTVFLSGIGMSMILCINPALQSVVYEMLKRSLRFFVQRDYLGDTWHFAFGAVGKIIATIVTYPLQVVQTRTRADSDKAAKYLNHNTSFTEIMRKEGVRGLFQGLEAKLLQTVLTAALMFVVYEEITYSLFTTFAIAK